ncbi:serine/threonine-protein kinase [Chiayiivirga flava]|uniref:Serine/threonine-protein kinase n=1 Tax=Chiayiivirga flava TaxID=659595 RepID=A0A7W8D2N1_9GAMM|nr:serine/threonine-protein kinase [Chiayiivirga flava]MBB5206845.1 serine/threonine-protein kinase [Chiayiivirga flava]
MSATHWQRLEALFDEGIELDPSLREAWLASLDIDDALRSELRAMLAADGSTGGLTGRLGAAVADATELPLAGQRLGPYRLVSELGAGGMGLVFLAERADEQFRQQVAIKLIRGFASSQAADQLRHERQLLAELDHPNIARLLDGGETVQGQPYLVMEYVRGEPVVVAARTRGLDLPTRLRLVRDLAFAVHYAHQRLIVHRDIKPANVLLREDGRPVLLDFGIAKLVDPDNLGSGLTQQWFTPAYASPEQRRGQPVSTATDIYALGLLLFELLTDTAPQPDADGELRAPSAVAAGHRRTLRGDLDRIVARATAGEPGARYASAEALAQDIERHLDGRPILAAPDRVGYRLGKFLRRHPFGVAAAAAAVLLLAGFAWRLVEERDRALQAEAVAQAESAAAASATDFLVGLFSEADPEKGRAAAAMTPVELIDRGRERLAERDDMPAAQRGRLLGTLGSIYRNLGQPEKATAALEQAVADARRGGADRDALIDLLAALASARDLRGEYAAGIDALTEALTLARGSDDAERDINLLESLGMLRMRSGDGAGAIAALEQARSVARARFGEGSVQGAQVDVTVAETQAAGGDVDRAVATVEPAIAQLRAAMPAGAPQLMGMLTTQASIYRQAGRYDDAERILQEVLQYRSALLRNDSILIANVHSELGSVYYDQGRTQEAATQFLRTLEVNRRVLAPDDPSLAMDYNNVASMYEEIGDFERAEPMMRTALGIVEQTPDEHRLELANYRQNLGRLLMLRGKAEEALHYIGMEVEGDDLEVLRRQRARRLLQLADWNRRFGDVAQARQRLDDVEASIDDLGGREGGAWAAVLRQRGLLAQREGDLAAAQTHLEAAHAHWAGLFGETFIGCGEVALELADVALARGRRDEARRRLDEARTILDPLLVPDAALRTQLQALRERLGGA